MEKTSTQIEEYMKESNKDKKQRRKSSISSESIKLLQNQKENFQGLLLKVVDSQIEWLDHQFNRLNKRLIKSTNKLEKTSAYLVAQKCDLNSSDQNENDNNQSILSKDQIEFLKSTEIEYDTIFKHLKKTRQKEIKKEIEALHQDLAKIDYNKNSFLSNSQARLSISASYNAQPKKEKKDLIQLANEYFDSIEE